MSRGAAGASLTSCKKHGSGSSTDAATPPASASGTSGNSAPAAPKKAPVAVRKVEGKKVTLGAGNYEVGSAIKAGIYTVSAKKGESGNFIVTGDDEYDEVLGDASDLGVPRVRVHLSTGDKVELSGLSAVTFAPVTAKFVTAHRTITVYAGDWIVGEDLGAGSYVAKPAKGESGNFIIDNQDVDEILGGGSADGGVPSVSFSVDKGDDIEISGLSKVVLTAT